MKLFDLKCLRDLSLGRLLLAFAALAAMALPRPAVAQFTVTSQATLLDRIQIEDLLINYYGSLGSGGEDMAQFYTEDAVLDVNGLIYTGKKAIQGAYTQTPSASAPAPRGKFHMLMSNPKIVVHGDSAVADVIWTGIISDTVKAPPRLVEQGREHDELVKRGGRWLLQKRVITSDGGLPEFYEKTYRDR